MNVHHLTDEQLSDLLAGEPLDAEMQAHLLLCEPCQQEIELVQSSISSFNQQSMAWARMAAPNRVPVPSRLALGLGGRPVWGIGFATMAVACLIAVNMGLPNKHSHPAPASLAVGTSAPTQTELAQDNRLMESINEELHYEVQPTISPAELRSSTHSERLAHSNAVID